MESESIVYGCIRDWPGDSMERRMRRAANRRVLDSLPGGEAWPFLGREMFSRCEQSGAGLYQTQIIHFGASYQAISTSGACGSSSSRRCSGASTGPARWSTWRPK